MATTKIFPIHSHLKQAVNYAINPEKTEDGKWTGFYNCRADQAHMNMMNTQKRFNQWKAREDSVQGHHIIQSFKPYEATAEIAEKIAQEFCERYLSDQYEVVYGIHTDKNHMHIHYVFNAVSFENGKKYQSNPKEYYEKIRPLSDELCQKHGLSVIQNPSKEQTLHYGEWKLKQSSMPTWKDLIKNDIDTLLLDSYNFNGFLELMKNAGYEIKQGKHIAFKPYGKERFVRGYKLGNGYDEESLRKRIDDFFEQDNYQPIRKKWQPKTLSFPCKGKRQKLKGFQAHYFRFLYAMNKVKTQIPQKTLHTNLRKELEKLETHKRIYHFLIQNQIQTPQDLARFTENQQDKLTTLEKEKKDLIPKHSTQQAFRNLSMLKKMQDGYDMFLAGNPIMQNEHDLYQKASENLQKLGYDTPEKVAQLLKEQRKLYQEQNENKDAIHDCKRTLKLCGSTAVMVQKIQTNFQEAIHQQSHKEVKNYEHGCR